jgi:hypothetical protein
MRVLRLALALQSPTLPRPALQRPRAEQPIATSLSASPTAFRKCPCNCRTAARSPLPCRQPVGRIDEEFLRQFDLVAIAVDDELAVEARGDLDVAANHLLSVLKTLINWGIPREFSDANPCVYVPKARRSPMAPVGLQGARKCVERSCWHATPELRSSPPRRISLGVFAPR